MKRIPLTTWILLFFSAFFAMAFDQDGDDDFTFSLNTYRTFAPGETVTININGRFRKGTTVLFEAYRINDPVAFFRDQPNVHSPGVTWDEEGKPTSTVNLKDATRYRRLKEWSQKVKGDRYWTNQEITVPVSEKGVYLITATARDKTATTVVIITEGGLILKRSDQMLLGYAVSLKDGRKMPGARMVFRNESRIVEGSTDADGVATVAMDALTPDTKEPNDANGRRGWMHGSNLVAFGMADGNFFISDSYYYRYWNASPDGNYRTYVHADRPVYRPSQTVYYRGIVRRLLEDGTYSLPEARNVSIEIRDSRGGEVRKDTVAISDAGTFHSELALGEEPPLGDYSMQVTIDDVSAGFYSFSVEEYKKPEYEVIVSAGKQTYTRGDRITATVQADYYFGSPVAEGTVEYRILRSHYWRPWWIATEWAYLYRTMPTYNPYGSEYVDGGQGKLNPDGSFTFSFDSPKDLEGDYTYTLVAQVTDASRREISGSTTVRVTRGNFFLTTSTDRYVYKPGERVTLNVGAWEFDGDKGVSTAFDVKVRRNWWTNDYGKRHEETVWSGSGRTGSDGTGSVTFDAPKAGYLTAEVSATDDRGNEITTSASVYVADNEYAGWDRGDGSVKIIPDRDLYKPGDVMSALVIMPVEGTDVLVTAEGPTIFNYNVERLSGNSAVIRIPIEERFAPVFFPSVATLVGDRMYSMGQQVMVAPEGKIVKLEITTDKAEYEPGEKGTVTVRALDAEGEPVPEVDLAVGIVDEAIYAIKPENAPEIEGFFYGQRWNEVQTSSSLDFRFHSPSIFGAVLRDAEVSAEGGGLGIRGGRANESAMNKLAYADEYKETSVVTPALRTDFRDLMFWTHSVRTDRSGYARLPVTFPDNLTTWRITARGVTRETQVGQATTEVIARKDLLVRMETPRFITQGDELVIATNVHNYLSTEKQVKVEFATQGVRQEKKTATVIIPPNGEKRVDWKITAPDLGTATLTVRALTDEESDAMEVSVPVLPLGVKTGTSAIVDIGEPSGSRDMHLALPANGKPETGELYVNLAPSAASSMLGALDDLIGYPYGCVEQTMSRFLPTVVVANVLQDLDVPFDQRKKEELPKMVEQGLTRLYALQHDDGGWGWWENDETNPFMTAYVMYGLETARKAEYQVTGERFDRGLEKLFNLIEAGVAGGGIGRHDGRLNATTEAYMLYVASVIGAQHEAAGLVRDRIEDLSDEKINSYSVALLALAAAEQGQTSIARELAARLERDVMETGGSASWSGTAWHYNWEDDEVETTAAAVKALLKIQGETDLVKKGVRWLLAQKEGDSWHNTRRTAMVIYSLVDYLRASNELEPDYTMTVKVNGRTVLTKRVTREDVFKPEQQVKVTAGSLRQGDNVVTVEKSGEGRLYASARLVYYATGDAIEPGQAGFKVTREYFLLKRVQRDGKYVYEKQKIGGPVKSGDEIFVKLQVTPERSYEYFMMEDPLPAGCEVITRTDGYTILGEDGYDNEDNGYGRYWRWNWWYADRDVRDEKVAFFATRIESRTYTLTYIMRAQIPGSYAVMPAVASLMYYPEVRGNSGTEKLAIVD